MSFDVICTNILGENRSKMLIKFHSIFYTQPILKTMEDNNFEMPQMYAYKIIW